MRRRKFVSTASVGVLCGSSAVWAQEPRRTYRLGVLVQPPRAQFKPLFDELGRHGFVEGNNLVVDPRGFAISAEALEETAIALVKSQPDAIYCGGDEAGRALQRATRTIPIATLTDNMVRAGLVTSLARPGSNITGVSIFAPELDGKRLELLLEVVPGVRRLAALVDPKTTAQDHLQALTDAASTRGVELLIHQAATLREIVPAIEGAQADRAQALSVLASAMLGANHALIIEQVARQQLPTIYQWSDYAKEGALVCYGPSQSTLYRQVARQLVMLLKGTAPADIPVQQPTQFALSINLQTAKALGLTIPPSILSRADEVID
jgi:putative ABC transport system substrate-binding protein